MKFPYGISDFRKISIQGYFYCDRTGYIPLIEKGNYLLFLRPRRFGKSLLLSMLANYYDVAKKDEFNKIFGKFPIGRNPTLLHNSYFILWLDFSWVDPSGTAHDIKKAFHDHINACIKDFIIYYDKYLDTNIQVDHQNALNSLKSLGSAVRMTPYPVYLLIDEYDNFANEVMMGVRKKENIYEALVHEEGPLKTFFKSLKSLTNESLFERIFITGVSPVVMSDITCGFNIAENIYLEGNFNELCGFSEKEIQDAIKMIVEKCQLKETDSTNVLNMMRTYYNGYIFSPEANKQVYNPTLAIYFLEKFYDSCKYPRKMLDANLAADQAKLRYIAEMPKGNQILMDIAKDDYSIVISDLADRFGINQMLSDNSKDMAFILSFLYYFGVLTMGGQTELGKLILKVPNLVTQGLYVERIREMLLPEPMERDDGIWAAEQLYEKGEMSPLCEFIEQRFFKVFKNRDYRWANELTVKTAFLTLLYNDILYIMDSEIEVERSYSDLTMIIRPDMRKFNVFDILIEFKFVSLKQANLTGKKAKELRLDDLRKISSMRTNMKDAKKQLAFYGDKLEGKYKDLRLRRYGVVSLGFERLLWEEV
jgi:hypothetical protein